MTPFEKFEADRIAKERFRRFEADVTARRTNTLMAQIEGFPGLDAPTQAPEPVPTPIAQEPAVQHKIDAAPQPFRPSKEDDLAAINDVINQYMNTPKPEPQKPQRYPSGENVRDEDTLKPYSPLGDIGHAVAGGLFSGLSSLYSAPALVSHGVDRLAGWGEGTVTDLLTGAARGAETLAAEHGGKVYNPNLMTKTLGALGSSLPFLAASATTGLFSGAPLTVAQLAMAGLESAGEAEQARQSALQRGTQEGDADATAVRTLLTNLLLNTATERAGFFTKWAPKGIGGVATRLAGQGLSEGLQEAGQSAIQSAGEAADGKGLSDYARALWDERKNARRYLAEEGLPAALSAGLLGVVSPSTFLARAEAQTTSSTQKRAIVDASKAFNAGDVKRGAEILTEAKLTGKAKKAVSPLFEAARARMESELVGAGMSDAEALDNATLYAHAVDALATKRQNEGKPVGNADNLHVLSNEVTAPAGEAYPQEAWHGRAVKLDKFAPTEEIAPTGEGFASHDKGLYVTPDQKTEEQTYSPIEPKDPGALYHSETSDSDVLLDEQKSLAHQSEAVQTALNQINKETGMDIPFDATSGREAYKTLAEHFGSSVKASNYLSEHGIKGTTYDGAQDGRCFVTFDPKDIKTLERYDQLGARGRRGELILTPSGEHYVRLFENADASTFVHELGHSLLCNVVSDGMAQDAGSLSKSQLDRACQILNIAREDIENKTQNYTDAQAYFARSFEGYLRRGYAPTSTLKSVFHRMKERLVKIYKSLRNLDVHMNHDLNRLFGELLTGEPAKGRIEKNAAGIWPGAFENRLRAKAENAFLYKNETAPRELENSSGLQEPPRDVVKETGAEYATPPNEAPDAEYSIAAGAEAPQSKPSVPIEASYKATTEETPDLVKLIREGKYSLRDEGGMTPDHVPTQGEQLTRIRDITKQLEKIAPLRTGSKLGPNTLGYYQPIADVARTRAKNDIDTALHEMGHAIDHKLDLRGRSGLAGRQIRQELAALGKETSPKNSTEQYLVNEGVAEFFRINAQNSEQAAKAAPLYARELSQALSEPGAAHIRETVEDLTRAVRDYYGQSATARGRANRLTGDDAPRKTLKERVEGWGMDFRRQWDDRLAPLEVVTSEIKKQYPGKYLPDELNVYAQARAVPGAEGAVAEHVEAMLKPLSGIKQENYDRVADYMQAAAALDYWANGMNPGVGYTVKEAARIVRDTPQNIVDIANQVKGAYDTMVDKIMVDRGMWSREQVDAWRAKYPNYSPFMRVDETGTVSNFPGSGSGMFVNVSAPQSAKHRRGVAERTEAAPIHDPIESMVFNALDFAKRSAENVVGQTIVNAAQRPGMGWLAEPVSGVTAKNSEYTFKVWQNGQRQEFATDRHVYQALLDLGTQAPSDNLVVKGASKVADWLKIGATRENPGFWAINFLRDAMYSSITSQRTGLGAIPLGGTFKGLYMQIAARLSPNMKARLDAAIEAGVKQAGLTELGLSRSRKSIAKAIKRRIGSQPIWDRAVHLWDMTVGAANEAIETAPKFAEFDSLRKRGVPAKQAAMQAREVNLDFSRAGTTGRAFNRVTAFFNPAVQGASKAIRTTYTRPGMTAAKVMLFAMLPSIISWALGHDDKDYQRISRAVKDKYWVFRVKGTWIKIPKAEIFGLFGSAVERGLDYAAKLDPEPLRGFADAVADQFTPNWIPTLLVPTLENWANRSTYTGRPIVPRYLESLPPEQQYTRNTSTIARKIGSLMGWSPLKIDNLVRGTTGGIGSYAVRLLDKPTEAKAITEQPILDRLTVDPLRSNEPVSRFYDLFDDIKLAHARDQRDPKGRLLRPFELAAKRISRYRRLMAGIDTSARLTPEQKRRQMDRFRGKISTLAERMNATYYRFLERRAQ